jgi:hypothetical protein
METLSDKEVSPDNEKSNNGFYWSKDIKQFIKDLKKSAYQDWCDGNLGLAAYHRELERIDKHAGEKLI